MHGRSTRIPKQRSSWLKAPVLVGSRLWTEKQLERRGLRFRDSDPRVAASAYSEMDTREFERINACQAWANWRTIPRLMQLVEIQSPWTVIDLGCGQGFSTEAIAWCCPAGSRLLGIDLSEPAVDSARARKYVQATGHKLQVEFQVQPIDQIWHSAAGTRIKNQSVTIVNASGIVGHHLSTERLRVVAQEIGRVLSPNGWAFLDTGPRIGRRQLRQIMQLQGFRFVKHVRSCWLDPYGQSAFRWA